jgi:hypothetical protein
VAREPRTTPSTVALAAARPPRRPPPGRLAFVALLLLLLEGLEHREHVAGVELDLLRRSAPPPAAHHTP